MLTRTELSRIARARMQDASVLFKAKRYDGSLYMSGYTVECALKARIVTTLRWPGFPSTSKEFDNLRSFKTHDFDTLLTLSGREKKIRLNHIADWSAVVELWQPEARYNPIGSAKLADAQTMIESVGRLLKVL